MKKDIFPYILILLICLFFLLENKDIKQLFNILEIQDRINRGVLKEIDSLKKSKKAKNPKVIKMKPTK